MFSYCGNNPVSRIDTTGQGWGILDFAKEAVSQIGQAFKAAQPAYAALGAGTFSDGPLPYADVAAGIAAAGLTVGIVGYGTYQAAKSISIPKTTTKNKTSHTVVYRYGGTNPGSFVPSPRDVTTNSGLSFSTIPPRPGKKAAVTTLEALNATGLVTAHIDNPWSGHVRVDPVIGTLADWRAGGSTHPCTIAVQAVCVKWDGGID